MRQQGDADAELFEFGRGLVDAAIDVAALQVERQSQTGDAAADDRDLRIDTHDFPERLFCPCRARATYFFVCAHASASVAAPSGAEISSKRAATVSGLH